TESLPVHGEAEKPGLAAAHLLEEDEVTQRLSESGHAQPCPPHTAMDVGVEVHAVCRFENLPAPPSRPLVRWCGADDVGARVRVDVAQARLDGASHPPQPRDDPFQDAVSEGGDQPAALRGAADASQVAKALDARVQDGDRALRGGGGLSGGRLLELTAQRHDFQLGEEPYERPEVARVGVVEAAEVAVAFPTG